MLAKALVIAMAADIARSDYAKPTLIRSRSREWLIACRWGPEGEYLSIATAGPITEPLALVAPQVIAPIHSLVGVLVSESESQSTSTFLLVRQLPGAIELAGTFFPADGYVLLQDHGDIHLVCKARYSHSCGWLDGKEIRKDIPDPAPYSAEAMSWHIEATRRDWIGEFIPGVQAAGTACDSRDRLTPSNRIAWRARDRRSSSCGRLSSRGKLPPLSKIDSIRDRATGGLGRGSSIGDAFNQLRDARRDARTGRSRIGLENAPSARLGEQVNR